MSNKIEGVSTWQLRPLCTYQTHHNQEVDGGYSIVCVKYCIKLKCVASMKLR